MSQSPTEAAEHLQHLVAPSHRCDHPQMQHNRENTFASGRLRCENAVVDRPKPRWVPSRLRPWLSKRWVQALLVVAVFAVLAVVTARDLVIEAPSSRPHATASHGMTLICICGSCGWE